MAAVYDASGSPTAPGHRAEEGQGVCARISRRDNTRSSPNVHIIQLVCSGVRVGRILIWFQLRRSAFRMWSRVVFVMSVIAATHSLSLGTRPRYVGCQTSDECGKDACCVVGMGRYSIPICQPRRELGEQCRPLGEPVNTTLHYPDGVALELVGVFYIACPCQGGLACGDSMECVDYNVVSNHIDQQYDYSEEKNFHY